MHVVATAGHVDHGKSTLVRALTGMEPDRLAEEQRRGLTIDLGFAWTDLAGTALAFVDVPGHERFVPNMLAGAGPAPAAMFVVAADEGWQAQSTEHLAALDAFGVRHGLLVVTKSDRADPTAATAAALDRIGTTSLGEVGSVAVSGHTGAGLTELRGELLAMVGRLPTPDGDADVRLWVDRVFTIRGAGTVVTGTLGAGTVRVGDVLMLGGRRAVVRGLQTLGRPEDVVRGVARVAVNLRGVEREDVRRGDTLLTQDAWRTTGEVDVLVRGEAALPRELVLHLGTAAVPCRVRPLGTATARLRLRTGLPLRAGDVGLLRDPGQHRIVCGVEVLDPAPPTLSGRGAARAREHELATGGAAAAHLRRHGAVPVATLRALGWTPQSMQANWTAGPEPHPHAMPADQPPAPGRAPQGTQADDRAADPEPHPRATTPAPEPRALGRTPQNLRTADSTTAPEPHSHSMPAAQSPAPGRTPQGTRTGDLAADPEPHPQTTPAAQPRALDRTPHNTQANDQTAGPEPHLHATTPADQPRTLDRTPQDTRTADSTAHSEPHPHATTPADQPPAPDQTPHNTQANDRTADPEPHPTAPAARAFHGVLVGDWAVDPELHRRLPADVEARFAVWSVDNPVAAGMPVATLRQSVSVPDGVLRAAIANTDLTVHNGLVRRAGATTALPTTVDHAVTELETRLALAPFAAPAAADLAALGLGPRELAAAARAGRLVRLTDSVVLAADALARATQILASLPAPFTVSDARRALGTTRRVAVPLLEHLDANGVTRRGADGTRRMRRD